MPFQTKVQPVDCQAAEMEAVKPAVKSRLKRLIERQFQSVMRISTAEKLGGLADCRDGERDEVEPSSLCLDDLVTSFIEEENNFDKPPPRGCCNCFNGNNRDDNSDDDFGNVSQLSVLPSGESVETIKSLVLCTSVMESKLSSDALKIVEKAKNCKDKDDRLRVIVAGLCALGYNSSLCKSKWERTASIPAGEHSYIDVVVVESGRLILDIDFKSEFEIARSTKTYRAVLQQLPSVFVGTAERLQQIVAVVSEAARQSLKKKGLHVPPWRKCEYMKAKWLSSYHRTTAMAADEALEELVSVEGETAVLKFTVSTANFSANVEKLEGSSKEGDDTVCSFKVNSLVVTPAPSRPKSGVKMVTGLASVL